MANSLNEDLHGRYVMLPVGWFKHDLRYRVKENPAERVFIAGGGFGCSPTTMGNAVLGEFVVDGEKCRIEGYEIERFATDEEVQEALTKRKALGLGDI